MERKKSGSPEHAAFRKLLTEILQASLTRAKFSAVDRNRHSAPSRAAEILHPGTRQPVLEHPGRMQGLDSRARRAFRAQRAGARDALEDRRNQADRKNIIPPGGRDALPDLARSRGRALSRNRAARFSATSFAKRTDLLQNRFLFVEGGNDDYLFLEHYVLLGNFVNDPDRFDIFDALLLDFVREYVLAEDNAEELSKARKAHERLLEQARLLRSELGACRGGVEEVAGHSRRRRRILSLGSSSARQGGPPKRVEMAGNLRQKAAGLEKNLEELAPQIDAAKQRMEFLTEEYQNRLGDYLNEPANARRLFDLRQPPTRGRPWHRGPAEPARACSKSGFTAWRSATCSFTCWPATNCARSAADYCPPIHLQQLKKALVNREEAKRVEQILEQFPARKVSMKKLEEASRAIRRRSHRGDAGRGAAIRRRPDAPAARPPELPAGGGLDGAHQPGPLGTLARTFPRQQKPVRVPASGRRPPGGRSGHQSRGHQGGRARLDRESPRICWRAA